MKKNDEFQIEITDMSNDGEGIGHANGMAFFVKGAVVGDVILAGATKLKKTYGYARIVKILSPSPDRVTPACPIANRCGGCSLQHLSYEAQLRFKQKKILDALIRIGGIERERFIFDGDDGAFENKGTTAKSDEIPTNQDTEIIRRNQNPEDAAQAHNLDKTDKKGPISFQKILGMDEPYHYRNKGQFPVGTDRNGDTICGFYATHSHDIINTGSCLLQHAITDRLMKAVRDYMAECGVEAYEEGGAGAKYAEINDNAGSRRQAGGPKHTSKGKLAVRGESFRNEKIVRHILTRVGFTTHEVMVCIVIAADDLPYKDRFVEFLNDAVESYNRENDADYSLNSVSFNINKENTNVIMGEKVVTIAGLPFITDYIGDLQYRISPLSFYQVNPVQTEELYSTALEFASPDEGDTVWDLYCGIGTISLYFARYVRKVCGIEIVPPAIEDANENAKLNGITNAEFICGAAEEVFPKLMRGVADMATSDQMSHTAREIIFEPKNVTAGEKHTPDIVIVDPPRKGCDTKLIDCIGTISPRKIVYVSCDPATLARDIKLLREYGYGPVKIRPVEMFPQTGHIEVCCLLEQKANY